MADLLLLLTLSLESALQAENWDEAAQLFSARSGALKELERHRDALTLAEHERIQRIDARIVAMLIERKASVANALIVQASETKARRIYRPARRNAGFEGSV